MRRSSLLSSNRQWPHNASDEMRARMKVQNDARMASWSSLCACARMRARISPRPKVELQTHPGRNHIPIKWRVLSSRLYALDYLPRSGVEIPDVVLSPFYSSLHVLRLQTLGRFSLPMNLIPLLPNETPLIRQSRIPVHLSDDAPQFCSLAVEES